MSLSIIILAAGKGTRMNSERPKVLHEVANYPMLFHILDTVKSLRPKSCNLVFSDKLKLEFKKIKFSYSSINFFEQVEQLGTGHAVMSVKMNRSEKNDDITLILFADTPLIETKTLKTLVSKIENNKAELVILSMKPNDTKNYGRVILKKNRVEKIVEFSEASISEKKINLCNSGVMAIKTNTLIDNISKINNNNSKKEFFLTDLVEILNKDKKVILHHECDTKETLGVNDRSDLQKVDKIFQERITKKLLKKGVTILDSSSVYFSYNTKIGKDSVIYPNVYFGLNVQIGKNVVIKSFSNIEEVEIKDGCEIGPFARIRNETKISKNARIGNFVELKKSYIQEDVKISHLSYIGDASIGKNTNIGAGTITCNYDGKTKNKTIIGENCFIGSNTSLIAPLEIEKQSIVGAGTVVKKDVSKGTTVFRKSELVRKKNKRD